MSLSVIIPVYNSAAYLDQAIRSALAQPQTGEVILIDDASTDGSWALCQAWPHPVRAYQHPDGCNHGPGASRNLGLAYSRGEYVAFLDADDYYAEDAFGPAWGRLQNDPTLAGTYGALQNFLGEPPTYDPVRPLPHLPPSADLVACFLAGELRFSHVTMVFRRDFLTTHFDMDCYATDLRFGEDHFGVLRALQRGRFALAHPTQPVVMRRRHPSSLTVAAGTVTTQDEAAARLVFAQRLAFCDRLWRWLQDDDLIGAYGLAALRYVVTDFTAHQTQYIPRMALWGGFWHWAQTAIPQADLRRAFYEILVARHLEVLEQQLQARPLYRRIPKAVQYKLKRYGLGVWLRARRDAQAPIPPDYAR